LIQTELVKATQDISPTSQQILQRRSKSAKFGFDFRQQSHLTSSGFETKQDIENLKHPAGAITTDLPYERDISLNPPIIFTWGQKVREICVNLNLTFEALYFRNEETHLQPKINFGSTDGGSLSFQNLV